MPASWLAMVWDDTNCALRKSAVRFLQPSVGFVDFQFLNEAKMLGIEGVERQGGTQRGLSHECVDHARTVAQAFSCRKRFSASEHSLGVSHITSKAEIS